MIDRNNMFCAVSVLLYNVPLELKRWVCKTGITARFPRRLRRIGTAAGEMTRPSRVRRLARLAKAESHGNGGATDDDREEEPPASDETAHAHATEENNLPLREAKLLIQKLDELGLGEAIGKEDFLDYYDQLPSPPPWIDLQVELEDGELHALDLRHALYRFRYYKLQLSQQVSKKEQPHHDNSRLLEEDEGWDWEDDARLKEDHLKSISEEDCTAEFLKEQGYFKHFEEDGTFDWFFHPGYLDCAGLNDYQRLVLRNYGGTEYARWSEYHRYFHSYKIEQEYVKYCEELFKKLKWMEDYLHFDVPSFKWDFISSRGAYQAIKIAATGFHEITPALAYNGYYECTESMSYDLTWFKELDGVYLEIWRRVTQQMRNFRDALEEVHNLNRFPLRQQRMKHALEFDDTMKEMEKEYHTCTADITSEVKEDEAQEFIADAVKKLVNKPKTYEQYIKKKIHIARAIGVIPEDLK